MMKKIRAWLLSGVASPLLLLGVAQAQTTSSIPPGFVFSQQGSTSIVASNTSSSTSISTSLPLILIQNPTTSTACVALGSSPVAVYPCPQSQMVGPGQSGTFGTSGQSSVAVVLGTSGASGTLQISEGSIIPLSSVIGSQQVSDTPTVQNAAYSSGNCMGGFRAVTVAANVGQSGFVTNFRVSSISGAVTGVVAYLFSANPSASTCTDKGSFSLATADVDKLIALPQTMTLAASTGASITAGSADFIPPRPFQAGGSSTSGVKTIYYALVATTTETPGSTTDIHTNTGVALN